MISLQDNKFNDKNVLNTSLQVLCSILDNKEIISKEAYYLKVIEKLWQNIPDCLKKNDDERFVSFEDFKNFCENNKIEKVKLLLLVDRIIKKNINKMKEDENIKDVNLLVWGVCGVGKTELLRQIGTVLNFINPFGNYFNQLQIGEHDTGTMHVTEINEFYFGNIRMSAIDKPGDQDVNKNSMEKIKDLKDLKRIGKQIDTILLVCDINKFKKKQNNKISLSINQKETIRNLAYSFKELGPEIWNKVTIVLSQVEEYEKCNFEFKEYNPVCDEGYDLEGDEKEEYDINWCYDTIKYMSKKKLNLQYRKKAISNCINSFLKKLYKNNFNENSEKTKNIFNKIKIVWGGFINDFKNINEIINSQVLPIPNNKFTTFGINEDLEIYKKMKFYLKSDAIIEKNWVNTLVNEIIINSNNNISINCNDINTDKIKNFEDIRNNKETEEDNNISYTGKDYEDEATKETGKSANRSIRCLNNEDTFYEAGSAVIGCIAGAFGGNKLFSACASTVTKAGPGLVSLNISCVIAGGIAGAVAGYCIYKYFF